MILILCALVAGLQSATSDTAVIARVGNYSITVDELLTSFEFGPAFVKRRPDPLRAHLAYMIDERLLATEAERLRYDTTAFVRERIAALSEDAAVEALYREDILSRVHPTAAQIELDVRRANTTVYLRWIFTSQEQDGRRLLNALARGASFDSLYNARKDTSLGPDGWKMTTTMLRLERDNGDIARIVEGIRVHGTSKLERGPDGFYLFHVDGFVQNPVVTETDASRLRQEAITLRTRIMADSLADRYVKTKMKGADPVISGEGFNIVRALIADRGLSRDTRLQWNIPSTFMTEAGPVPISASGSMMDRTLVTFGNESFSVRDYSRWYDLRQFQLDTRTPGTFNSSVKRTIWKMVQDHLLSTEATLRGIPGRNEVQRNAEAWQAKILYLAGRSHVQRSVSVNEEDLRTKFSRDRGRFRNPDGKVRSFNEVRSILLEEITAEQEIMALRAKLKDVRTRVNVWIDEQTLESLSSGIHPEPQPLEAVFYKPGGTFPRVAFPTIDEAWERTQ